MNDYQFSLSVGSTLVGEGYGQGNNALEAFENAVKFGSVILPVNEPVTVVAVSQNGLGIKFEANKVF